MKFIHCADLHLGSAFLGLGRDLPELAGMLEQGCDFEAAEPWDGFFRPLIR